MPARISALVLGATLLTSLAVTAISTHSIDSFLRGKIEQKFPSLLESTQQRLDIWYDQRMLEMGVFSSSAIVAQNLGRLRAGESADSARARSEVEQYLSYVLDSFPQYTALFALDTDGEELIWVGEPLELPAAVRRRVAALEQPLSELLRASDGSAQLASARISDGESRPLGSLHAVIPLSAVGAVIQDDFEESLSIYLVDDDGSYLRTSADGITHGVFDRPFPDPASDTAVSDYTDPEGQRLVGAARHLPRFGWTLVVEEPYTEAFAPVVASTRRVLSINLGIVLLLGLVAFRLAAGLARPIEALSVAARAISEGQKDVEVPESRSHDEVGILTRTFRDMTRRLAANADELEANQTKMQQANARMREQNEELQRMNEILEQLSITDGLTKLHNHRFFQEYLAKEAKRAERTAEPLTLVLIDIDHFKAWNDRLGHSGGDDILRRIAELMNKVTRETDLLARYGGEEFALLLPNTEIAGAVRLAEKIRSELAEADLVPEAEQPITVSMGISSFGGDRRAFFDAADRALYRAKASGRDCVMVAQDEDEPDGLDA